MQAADERKGLALRQVGIELGADGKPILPTEDFEKKEAAVETNQEIAKRERDEEAQKQVLSVKEKQDKHAEEVLQACHAEHPDDKKAAKALKTLVELDGDLTKPPPPVDHTEISIGLAGKLEAEAKKKHDAEIAEDRKKNATNSAPTATATAPTATTAAPTTDHSWHMAVIAVAAVATAAFVYTKYMKK